MAIVIARKTRDQKQQESDEKYFKRWVAWLEEQDYLASERK